MPEIPNTVIRINPTDLYNVEAIEESTTQGIEMMFWNEEHSTCVLVTIEGATERPDGHGGTVKYNKAQDFAEWVAAHTGNSLIESL